MPNPIKRTTGAETLALKKGNFYFGTGDVGKGPSETTGYYQGVNVPTGGYTVYQYNESQPGGLSYGTIANDSDLIVFTNGISGQTFTTVAQCLTYFDGQTDRIIFNRDYEPIVTDGLVLNVDAGFDASYPEAGTTWRDISTSGNNGTLINSPGYYANGGGGIVFDGVDDYFFKDIGFYSTFTLSVWVYPVSGSSFLQYGRHPQNFTPLLFINASTTTLTIYTNNYYQSFSNSIILNSWNLITVVASTDTALREVFVNGVSKGSNTFSILGVTNGELTVGRGYSNQYANCSVSSVLFYNRTLSSSQVLQNYNAMKDRFAFIFTVDTTKTGVSTSTQFKLPLVSSGTINFVVEWGDGTSDTITTFNQAQTTHTFSSGGVYEIKIRGALRGWQFNNDGDRLKMLNVSQWSGLNISVGNGFHGCTNLTATATDAPIITTNTFRSYFQSCTNFDGAIGNWNVSSITNFDLLFFGARKFNQPIGNWIISSSPSTMFATFLGAILFNQNIGNWDVSNVTSMFRMFQNATAFNNGGSSDINNWTIRSLGTSMGEMFAGASSFNQNIGNWDVSNVGDLQLMFNNATSFNNGGSDDINNWTINTASAVNMSGMFNAASLFNQNIGNWNTSSVTNMSLMFRQAFAFNNGSNAAINNWNTSSVTDMTSMFESATSFSQNVGSWNTSAVTGMSGMFLNAPSFSQNIGSWNTSAVTNMSRMFEANSGFNNGGSATINNWNTSAVTNMSSMFENATTFNQNIGSWDVSSVTNMEKTFRNMQQFNQNIGSWNTSSVTNMSGMFLGCSQFNQNIGSWNVTAVTNMSSMFANAFQFNQNIGAWNVSNVTTFASMFNNATAFNNGGSDDINNWTIKTTGTVNMSGMFGGSNTTASCKFNRYIGDWNTSAVTNMSSMFTRNTAFNQNIGSWNTSAVTIINAMFQNASSFNQNIGSWNVGSVTDMNNMFSSNFAFNQNIGSWNVSNVTSFTNMFGASAFNNGGSSDINNWTIKATGSVSMGGMFSDNGSFNQPIGNWNTSAVTTMLLMFRFNPAFNQDIGSWNVSNVTNFSGFMGGKSAANYSAANLDSIYNGWSSRPVKPNISIDFGTIKYNSTAQSGKNTLTSAPNNWTITDGGTV